MFDHLSGERREFFDPLMPHKLISNTELMSAQVTDAIALPVVNCAFLRSGDYVRFKAVGYSRNKALVEVVHEGTYVDEGHWVGSTTVDTGSCGEAWHYSGVVFDTELSVNAWLVARTNVQVAGSDGYADSRFADNSSVETTALDTGWFLVRLIAPVAGDYGLTRDSEIKIAWGDLHDWYSGNAISRL